MLFSVCHSVSGFTVYLTMEHSVEFPPSQYWYCSVIVTVLETAMLCGTFLLVAMTFDRFYSIVRPHKAASFNTIKRTKIVISLVIVSSIVFNIPHLFTSDHQGWQCLPYGKANRNVYGQMFYWFSCIVAFVIPFVSLLSMNSVIIHKLRTRSILTKKESRKSGSTDMLPRKNSDTQVLIMLLIVTFGFLVLVTPALILIDFQASPQTFAGYFLFYSVAQKLRFSNHDVNFLFYVISGEKFRTDLKHLILIPLQFQKKNEEINIVSLQ